MNPPVWVYLGYFLYLIYTGFYVYNRISGRSAQFGTARVSPDDGKSFKFLVDCAVAMSFLFLLFVLIWISLK
jgi:hypothetical protein